MRKAITFMVTLLFIFSLAGCSAERSYANKPDNMSKEIYDYGRDALDVCDKYLAEQKDFDTAKSEIDKYYEAAKKFNDENDYGASYLDLNNTDVETSLLDLTVDFTLEKNIKEHRDELAEKIGK